MTETITACGVVYGEVQGVWFRAFTREQAQKYKLGGYARNRLMVRWRLHCVDPQKR